MTAAAPATAAVTLSTPSGFVVSETAQVTAPPARAYAALHDVAHWWSAAHTYSGDARNLSLDLKPGGCFCEALPGGGGADFMRVAVLVPGRKVILRGALGPLAGQAVSGALTVSFAPAGSGTKITLQYAVGGLFTDPRIDWAHAVDGVLDAQTQRLARLIDTGQADAPKTK